MDGRLRRLGAGSTLVDLLGSSSVKLSRRSILKASLGLSQFGLLGKFGLLGRAARASSGGGPTKLLTVFMSGGWMPIYLWCPLSNSEINSYLLPINDRSFPEPVFFTANEVTNLDGSLDALEGPYQRLRVPNLWNRQTGRRSPHGRAWEYFRLWENCAVVHGVDQGTAAHDAGRVCALSGVASSEFRSPAVNALAANGLFSRFENRRPLPSVVLGSALHPESAQLRSDVSPISIGSVDDLRYGLSQQIGRAWDGLEAREARPQVDFSGRPIAGFSSNAIEERRSARLRALRGRSTRDTDALLEKLYNTYQGVSRLLARDIMRQMSAIPDYPRTRTLDWVVGPSDFSFPYVDGGDPYELFNLTLKLLKSDLVTSLAIEIPVQNLDTHVEGHGTQFLRSRAAFDVIGRFLGVMKNSPATEGPGSLLDETLVLIVSEFSRTWPRNNSCDHWPSTSVAFLGGGVAPNRMIGGYPIPSGAPISSVGFVGQDITFEDGSRRQPRAADVLHTALRIMGVQDFFIPGGSNEIPGVRA